MGNAGGRSAAGSASSPQVESEARPSISWVTLPDKLDKNATYAWAVARTRQRQLIPSQPGLTVRHQRQADGASRV